MDLSSLKKAAPIIRLNNRSQDFTTVTRLNRKQALMNQSVDLHFSHPYTRDMMDSTIRDTEQQASTHYTRNNHQMSTSLKKGETNRATTEDTFR